MSTVRFCWADLAFNVGGGRQDGVMDNPAERLADLRAQVAHEVGALLAGASLHSASDSALADSVALAGDLLRLVEAALIDGVGELAERSRSLRAMSG